METNTKEKFIELYNNPEYTAHEIKQILGLNNNNYRKLKEETGLTGRRNTCTQGKHYSELKGGKVAINKRIKGQKIYLGVYRNKKEADKVINICKEHDWDINNREVNETIQKYRVLNRNYGLINGRYYVYKNIKGKRVYYDSFSIEQDAIDCVRLLNRLDWNKTAYDSLKVII